MGRRLMGLVELAFGIALLRGGISQTKLRAKGGAEQV